MSESSSLSSTSSEELKDADKETPFGKLSIHETNSSRAVPSLPQSHRFPLPPTFKGSASIPVDVSQRSIILTNHLKNTEADPYSFSSNKFNLVKPPPLKQKPENLTTQNLTQSYHQFTQETPSKSFASQQFHGNQSLIGTEKNLPQTGQNLLAKSQLLFSRNEKRINPIVPTLDNLVNVTTPVLISKTMSNEKKSLGLNSENIVAKKDPMLQSDEFIIKLNSSKESSDRSEEQLGKKDFAVEKKIAEKKDQCCECKSGEIYSELKCKHKICVECLKKSVKKAADSEVFYVLTTSRVPAKCPLCQGFIEEKHYKNTDWFKEISNFSIERHQKVRENIRKCFKCSVVYKQHMFFAKDPCKHLCKDCYSTELLLSHTSCSYCKRKYENIEEIGKELENCSGCKEDKYTVGDLIIHICEDHGHCYSCMINALRRNRCECCEKPLQRSDVLKIHQRVISYMPKNN